MIKELSRLKIPHEDIANGQSNYFKSTFIPCLSQEDHVCINVYCDHSTGILEDNIATEPDGIPTELLNTPYISMSLSDLFSPRRMEVIHHERQNVNRTLLCIFSKYLVTFSIYMQPL